ncbi:serine/threonine-protein phosphatase 4 regulatory subunit 2 [Bacillus rossius redtenbacheri]|uniref:serine/threonine-protein phosphatase 4 regulatory subunit 2 n=1 Tax=Bacillus rossius redtenbacheri TaxID=93214 RepID=UPI002FDCA499
MENAEGILQTLEEYVKLKPNDIPSELNDYLAHVAKTGDPVFQWSVVKFLFRDKLAKTITEFYESCPAIDLPPCPNVDAFNYEVLKNSLLERLDTFSSAPFTVQRICELLIYPRKEYSRVDKYMRAIEKNILVVSTKEPGIPKRPEGIQSEPVMNGVIDTRGIELGEAIETVSSEGVNLMHADSSDVPVPESVRLLDCSTADEMGMEECTNRPLASMKAWQKNQPTVLLVTGNGDSKTYGIKEQQDSLSTGDRIIENIELSNNDCTKISNISEPDTSAESGVEAFNQVIINEVADQVCSSKNESPLIDETDKAVFDINLSEITPNKSPEEDVENTISSEIESTTENIVSEAIAIVEENIKKECESDENTEPSTSTSEVCHEASDQLHSSAEQEPIVEPLPDTLDKLTYETPPTLGTVITVREDVTESPGKEDDKETCSVTISEIVCTQEEEEEVSENSDSLVESQSVHEQDDSHQFVVAEESDASVNIEPVKVAVDETSLSAAPQPSAATEVLLQSEQSATQEECESRESLASGAMVAGGIEEDLCAEANDMEPVEIEAAVEQDEAMDVDETSLPMEVATEEEPMDQSEEMPGAGGGS